MYSRQAIHSKKERGGVMYSQKRYAEHIGAIHESCKLNQARPGASMLTWYAKCACYSLTRGVLYHDKPHLSRALGYFCIKRFPEIRQKLFPRKLFLIFSYLCHSPRISSFPRQLHFKKATKGQISAGIRRHRQKFHYTFRRCCSEPCRIGANGVT